MIFVHGGAERKREDCATSRAQERGSPRRKLCGSRGKIGDGMDKFYVRPRLAEFDGDFLLESSAGRSELDRSGECGAGGSNDDLYGVVVWEIRALNFRPGPEAVAAVEAKLGTSGEA